MLKKYIVRLSEEERAALEELVSSGCARAQKIRHAKILLQADASGPNWTDSQIKQTLETSQSTIERVREAFACSGIEASLNRKPLARKDPDKSLARKLDRTKEERLLALADSPAPHGHKRWSLRLLANKMVEMEHIDGLSYETVRRALKRNDVNSRWRGKRAFR